MAEAGVRAAGTDAGLQQYCPHFPPAVMLGAFPSMLEGFAPAAWFSLSCALVFWDAAAGEPGSELRLHAGG